MKKFVKQLFLTLVMTILLTAPFAVLAISGIGDRMNNVATEAGFNQADETSLATNLGLIISTLLSFLGILFIILMIIGGYQWMTAGGNQESVKSAQGRIKNALIGLIVVVSSYAIWNLVERFFIRGL